MSASAWRLSELEPALHQLDASVAAELHSAREYNIEWSVIHLIALTKIGYCRLAPLAAGSRTTASHISHQVALSVPSEPARRLIVIPPLTMGQLRLPYMSNSIVQLYPEYLIT